MSESQTAAAAPKPSFWSSIVAGPDGAPGEFQLAFVVFQAFVIIGMAINTYVDHHFATDTNVGMEGALLTTYQAVLTGSARLGGNR